MRLRKHILPILLLTGAFLVATADTAAQTTRDGNGRTKRATNTVNVQGRVVDESGQPMEMVYVIVNGSLPVITDRNGNFTLSYQPGTTIQYTASYVGFEETRGTYTSKDGSARLRIVMKEANLALSEVTVTARQMGMGSHSTIGGDAIRHIQPKSLSDMFQLLPGSVTTNPTLNNMAQANVREIDGNANNAQGTAVVVDGIPLSNDANLQVLSPTRNGNDASTRTDFNSQTTAGRGVDLRTVSADNIESVDVIRGIPSVEYGNLTSGVVIVKTKAGRTPLEMKLKTDPFSKMAYAGKGFGLGSAGSLNVGMDWSQSYADQRQHYKGYDRITASVGYSNVFPTGHGRTLTLNVNGAFYSNINEYKDDPQMSELGNTFKNKNVGGRLALHGNWRLNSWLTALDYDFSAQYAHTEDISDGIVHNPQGLITDSRESGMSIGQIFTRVYRSHYKIDGRPINLFFQLKTNKYIQLAEQSYTNLKLGTEFRLDGNNGRGMLFDVNNPPQSTTAQTIRPRSFKDIPSLSQLSVFAEDVSVLQLGATELRYQAGLRLSTLMLNEEKARRNSITVLEPRINLEYAFLTERNSTLFKRLSLTGGIGLSNKMPTLLMLYPDHAYYDMVSLNRAGADGQEGLGIATTQVVEHTQNPGLKPANSLKWEVGVNAQIKKMTGYVTFFRERHKNEFGYLSQQVLLNYRRFDIPTGASDLQFNNPDVSYLLDGTRQTASYTLMKEMEMWAMPANTQRTDKWGIEYGWDFGTFKPLQTSLNIDGAWFHIKRRREVQSLKYVNRTYPYMGLMPAGDGSVKDRINTNFRFITHIPRSRMVFTTTVQVVWNERTRDIWEGPGGGNAYRLNSNGTRYIVSPIGYYDTSGNYTAWTPEMSESTQMRRMQSEFYLYDFEAESIHPWVMLNFRFTKEFGKYADLSFMANNFLNLKKWYVDKHSLDRSQIYPDMYFGAELKLKF